MEEDEAEKILPYFSFLKKFQESLAKICVDIILLLSHKLVGCCRYLVYLYDHFNHFTHFPPLTGVYSAIFRRFF